MKIKQNNFNKILLSALITALVIFGIYYFISSLIHINKIGKDKNSTSIQREQVSSIKSQNSSNTEIVPSKEGWLKFTVPSGRYSFEYPSDWKVDPDAEAMLKYYENGNSWPIIFMTEGRGGFDCEKEEKVDKHLGGRLTRWDKCIRNSYVSNIVITFPNQEFANYFIGIDMLYVPTSNLSKIEKLMEEVVSSLKEYPEKIPN